MTYLRCEYSIRIGTVALLNCGEVLRALPVWCHLLRPIWPFPEPLIILTCYT